MWLSYVGGRNPTPWAIFCSLPRYTRKLDQEHRWGSIPCTPRRVNSEVSLHNGVLILLPFCVKLGP